MHLQAHLPELLLLLRHFLGKILQFFVLTLYIVIALGNFLLKRGNTLRRVFFLLPDALLESFDLRVVFLP